MNEGKKLVVFYSLGGNTKFISEEIKREEKADILELKLKKDIKSKGFLKYLIGGRQAIADKKPELLPYNVDLDDYETIFIGSPIWANHFSPAINTFLSQNSITNKDIALFCCHAGGGEGKAFKHYKEKLKGNRFIGEIELKDPLKAKDESVNKLKKWLQNI